MSVTLGSNIASLKTQRRLSDATRGLTTSFERLSSGLRINKASDDAAGLSISEGLNYYNRISLQASRNAKDAQSKLNIADSALGELSNIVTRIAELSQQAGTGSITSTQRNALDAEAQALRDEYNRVIEVTSWNGTKIFNLNATTDEYQVGEGENGILRSDIGKYAPTSATASGVFAASSSYGLANGSRTVWVADYNGDNKLDVVASGDEVRIFIGIGDGTFSTTTALETATASTQVMGGDFDGDSKQDFIFTSAASNAVFFRRGNGDGTFSARTTIVNSFIFGNNGGSAAGDFNGDGFQDFAYSEGTELRMLYGNGNGTFRAPATMTIGDVSSFETADFNGDGRTDLAIGDYGSSQVRIVLGAAGFGNPTTSASLSVLLPVGSVIGDYNGDGKLDIASRQDAGNGYVFFGNGNGTFGAGLSGGYTGEPVASIDANADGRADLVFTDGSALIIGLSNGDGTFSRGSSIATGNEGGKGKVADFNGDGVLDVAFNQGGSVRELVVGILGGALSLNLTTVDLTTQSAALTTLDSMRSSLSKIAAGRGKIGADVGRLGFAESVASQTALQTEAARSRIRDADVAEEVALLTRNQILQQAGTAVLAQANQAPALALRLLSIQEDRT